MELVKVGDALAAGKNQIDGYDLSCVDLSKFNGDEWKVLREHILYAHNKYPYHRPLATGGVQLVPFSSLNVPIWPGISLDKEVFYGPDEGAIHVLVHEPMHNLTREGLTHDWTYFNDVSISDVVGPYSMANFMSRFITLLQRSNCTDGTSLWSELRKQSKVQKESSKK